MTCNSDILFMAEYIKNVLYFATVRDGITLKNSKETHYFSIDNELVYENYYSDFGPLNLGCVYKYCKILNEKLKLCSDKQTIVHFTSVDPKKKSNSAFLLGCFGVLYMNLQPKDALKRLMVHGQSYRPFQDATQGESAYTISHLDCLQSMMKAKALGFFDFQDFDYEEYSRLDKIQGGDLNWIVPGKFLAFIGPVNYSVSLYHPPEMYVDYFLENNVKIVIRLNKRMYDGNVFNNSGINHYDLFFPDGSCPPRHILMKFIQICEESNDAIAVHCKAGLGRTGSLIGCYLMKHYRMTSHEAIGWMRICRPGSVIGHQQAWLEQLESWLMKQGNLYRKRAYNDVERVPFHEFGVYSILEKTLLQESVMFHKPPPPQKRIPVGRLMPSQHGMLSSSFRANVVKLSEDKLNDDDEEIFLASCDLTDNPAGSTLPAMAMKGCIIPNDRISEEHDDGTSYLQERPKTPLWAKILCCKPCKDSFRNVLWNLSVRCANVAPKTCRENRLCTCIDTAAASKTKKDPFDQRHMKRSRESGHKINQTRGKDQNDSGTPSRRTSGAGDPRTHARQPSSSPRILAPFQKSSSKFKDSLNNALPYVYGPTITTFRTTNGPMIKNVTDARNFLLKSSLHNEERKRQLISSATVTPRSITHNTRSPNITSTSHAKPPPQKAFSSFSTASRDSTQPLQRRRLGRSPSPSPQGRSPCSSPQGRNSGPFPQGRMCPEQTRATNTPVATTTREKPFILKRDSTCILRDALSRLDKLTSPRDGSIPSIGAASLGARRDAPAPKRAPSVRSDQRPLATQGDLLNSIKLQRRLRETLHTEKFYDKLSNPNYRDKQSVKNANSRTSTLNVMRQGISQHFSTRENAAQQTSADKIFSGPTRPSSPKGRRSPHSQNFY